jgi:hypothetical protein
MRGRSTSVFSSRLTARVNESYWAICDGPLGVFAQDGMNVAQDGSGLFT